MSDNPPQAANPTRLELARRRRGITKRALADAAGLTSRTLFNYWTGSREPTPEAIQELAAILRFPVGFFYGETLEEPSDNASFRALSNLTSKQRDQALAAGALGLELSDWIERIFNVPPVNVPHYAEMNPESAAMKLRQEWGLGDRPVENLVHLLEYQGVRVFALAEDARTIDAYSFWREDVPYIFLNTEKGGERGRMDAAHEMGHLVLHREPDRSRHRQMESEATEFGSAFLMPRKSLMARKRKLNDASLDQLLQAKPFWKVSIAALAVRLHTVGLLGSRRYHAYMKAISRKGWRTSEPEPSVPREGSYVLGEVFRMLREQGQTLNSVAAELEITPGELSALLLGFVFVALPADRPEG